MLLQNLFKIIANMLYEEENAYKANNVYCWSTLTFTIYI